MRTRSEKQLAHDRMISKLWKQQHAEAKKAAQKFGGKESQYFLYFSKFEQPHEWEEFTPDDFARYYEDPQLLWNEYSDAHQMGKDGAIVHFYLYKSGSNGLYAKNIASGFLVSGDAQMDQYDNVAGNDFITGSQFLEAIVTGPAFKMKFKELSVNKVEDGKLYVKAGTKEKMEKDAKKNGISLPRKVKTGSTVFDAMFSPEEQKEVKQLEDDFLSMLAQVPKGDL